MGDPARSRYGCFLPDLTGLASAPSAADLPDKYISTGARAPSPASLRRGKMTSFRQM